MFLDLTGDEKTSALAVAIAPVDFALLVEHVEAVEDALHLQRRSVEVDPVVRFVVSSKLVR